MTMLTASKDTKYHYTRFSTVTGKREAAVCGRRPHRTGYAMEHDPENPDRKLIIMEDYAGDYRHLATSSPSDFLEAPALNQCGGCRDWLAHNLMDWWEHSLWQGNAP